MGQLNERQQPWCRRTGGHGGQGWGTQVLGRGGRGGGVLEVAEELHESDREDEDLAREGRHVCAHVHPAATARSLREGACGTAAQVPIIALPHLGTHRHT